jgi:hypothetical protein
LPPGTRTRESLHKAQRDVFGSKDGELEVNVLGGALQQGDPEAFDRAFGFHDG